MKGDYEPPIPLEPNRQYLQSISQAQLQFYRLKVTDETSDLHIYLTPIGDEDSDLFVSWNGVHNPTKSSEIDASSRNDRGVDYLIIHSTNYTNSNNNGSVYIVIEGWISGKYTLLYRFMDNNKFQIYDNIPQFFIIDITYNSYAMIKYNITANNNNDMYSIWFYLDSYAANAVIFDCWITINNEPNKFDAQNDDNTIYYSLLSSSSLTENDKNAIKCIQNNTIASCYGHDKDGNDKQVDITNDFIYFTVLVPDGNGIIDLNELEITINKKAYINDIIDNCYGISESDQILLFADESQYFNIINDGTGNGISPQFFYYEFSSESLNCDLQFIVTPVMGNIETYLSYNNNYCPSNESHLYESIDDTSQIITINNAKNSIYHIGIYPNKDSLNSHEIEYTITLTQSCVSISNKSGSSYGDIDHPHINVQNVTISPTLLTVNTPIIGELTSSKSYSVFDFIVYSTNIDGNTNINGELTDFYITTNALTGSVGLYVNKPNHYPKVPTTAVDSDYFSADISVQIQSIHITHNDLTSALTSNGSSTRSTYRCVVGLLNQNTYSRYIIVINQQIEGDITSSQDIIDGVPIPYTLNKGSSQLFKYEATEDIFGVDLYEEDLTVVLATMYGDPSMYIGFNNDIVDRTNPQTYNWSTSLYGADSVRINGAMPGIYNILVYAGDTKSTRFTLTATSSATAHILNGGVTYVETVNNDKPKYYIFYPSIDNNNEISKVILSVLSFNGHLNVYVSSNGLYQYPDSTNNDHTTYIIGEQAMQSKSLIITLQEDYNCNFETLRCKPMYIAVKPLTLQATYSIMVTQNTVLLLTDGITTQSTLQSRSQYTEHIKKYFRFVIDRSSESISEIIFTLSCLIQPQSQIYMTVYPTGNVNNNTLMRSVLLATSSQSIIIKSNEQGFCLNSIKNSYSNVNETIYTYDSNLCYYLISISSTQNISSNFDFNILAHTDKTFITLQNGITITDSINTGGTLKYYNFYLNKLLNDEYTDHSTVLEVDVTPTYGDPDLYIALNVANNKLINITNGWKWRSMRFGADSIAIPIENSSYLGIYQIGVYGYSKTLYQLTAYIRKTISSIDNANDQQALIVFAGQIRYDYLGLSKLKCYEYWLHDPEQEYDDNLIKDNEMEITINVHVGQVDVYVAYDTIPENNNNEEWDKIQTGILTGFSSPKIIPITADDFDLISNKIYICVQGTLDNNLYEFSIDYLSSLKQLIIGETIKHTLAYNKTDYYYVNIFDTSMDFYINIESTSANISAPFAYISKSNRHPDLSIKDNDTQICTNQNELNQYESKCTMKYDSSSENRLRVILLTDIYISAYYYIAVTPTRVDTSYSITCTSTVGQLFNGNTLTDQLVAGNWKYYVYSMTSEAPLPIIITYTLLSGNTAEYITNSNVTHSDFDVINDKSRILIDNGTSNIALNYQGSFTTSLSETINSRFYCKMENGEFYFNVDDFSDFDPFNFLEDIEEMELNTIPKCEYYIAVYAVEDSSFSINIHLEGDLTELKNDGTPSSGHYITEGNYTYYYTTLTNVYSQRLQILVTDMDLKINNEIYIYVNYDNDNDLSNNSPDYSNPSENNNQYISSSGEIIIENAQSGTYFISVYSKKGDHYYSILTTTSRIILLENYPQTISARYQDLYELSGKYFAYDVLKSSSNNNIEFKIYSHTNDADRFTLWITNSELMNQCHMNSYCPAKYYCTQCTPYTNHKINSPVIIEATDDNYCKYNNNTKLCTYYIGVFLDDVYQEEITSSAKDEDTLTFSITASSATVTSGIISFDGEYIESTFAVAASSETKKQYHYYRSYLPENQINDIEITLETCSGNVDLYSSFTNVFVKKSTSSGSSENIDEKETLQINEILTSNKVLYISARDSNNNNNNNPSSYRLFIGYQLNKYEPKPENNYLSVNSEDYGSATFTFKLLNFPADFDSETDFTGHNVNISNYGIYFSDYSNPYVMYTHCGLNKMSSEWLNCKSMSSNESSGCFINLGFIDNNNAYIINSTYYSRTIYGLKINTLYQFNILVETSITNINNELIRKVYTTYKKADNVRITSNNTRKITKVVIKNNNSDITIMEIAFGITIPIIFMLIGFVYYYYKKHQKVERDLSILEMEEVPINSVVKAIGGRPKFSKYNDDGTLSKKEIKKRKKQEKERKKREKSKKYSALLSSHESQSDDDDKLVYNIDNDDDDDDGDDDDYNDKTTINIEMMGIDDKDENDKNIAS